jgi:glycolate oxidase
MPASASNQRSVRRLAYHLESKIGAHKVQTAPEILTCYGFDATNMQSLPAAVVFPETGEEVRAVVGACHEYGVLVVPRGAGTGFVGGTVPLDGGVVVSTEKLARIVTINREEHTALVQAGVVNSALQREAARAGLMFPPDPSSLEVSTLGGNISQDAGGPRALKYGVTRHYVLGVEFVTWDGKLVESPAPLRNSSRWAPLSTLVTGGEGTLGVITSAWLKLLPRPAAYATALAYFKTTVDAAGAVSRVLDSGVLPAAIELLDARTIDCISEFVDLGIPRDVGCSLLVETDGRPAETAESMRLIEEVLQKAGATSVRAATGDGEREDLWKMRRSISPALARMAPNKINEDVCVPRSRLPDLAAVVGRLADKYGLLVPTFGHAGDGNLHVNVMLDRRVKDEERRARVFVDELFRATVDLGGSISGEHGVGVTKLPFLKRQVGADGMQVQNRIKRAFDPYGLVNPGKVVANL